MLNLERLMGQTTGVAAIAVMAAVSVAVGLTGAGYDPMPKPQESSNLLDTIAGILGIDRKEINDYLQRETRSSADLPGF